MPEIITGQDAAAQYEAAGGAEEQARVDTARAELYDEAAGGEQEPGSDLILGKYRNQDELATAYQNLQREYQRLKGGQPQAEQDAAPDAEPEAGEEGDGEEDGAGQVMPPEQVERIKNAIFQQAGGEAEYQRLAGWAAKNLPAERTNAYNKALSSGDEAAIVTALKGLQYDFMMQNGYEPRLTGGRAPSNQVKGFESEAQVIAAMKDPRYSGDNPDPAYIREVEQRVAVSNVFQSR